MCYQQLAELVRHAGSAAAASTSHSSGVSQQDLHLLDSNPRWAAYKASLTKNGYFKGNISGSSRHKALLVQAAQSFMQSQVSQGAEEEEAASPAQRIAELMTQPVDIEQFKVERCVCCIKQLGGACRHTHTRTHADQCCCALINLKSWL